MGLTPKEQGLLWVSILAADALAYSVARSSAVMALSLFYVEILTAYAIFVWINDTKCINIYMSGFMQDCIISFANTLELTQSCTKPSIYVYVFCVIHC